MPTLAEIRAKLQASNQANNQSGPRPASSLYPHWDQPEGSSTVVRFLPDGDATNSYFWKTKDMIRLPFAGVKGQAGSKPCIVQVPCMEMWGETCPVLTQVRPWFEDKSLMDLGRKYWKKKSFIFHGFVVDSKTPEQSTPENPIRQFIFKSQIFNIVKSSLLDPEIEEIPIDYVRGLDFRVEKTKEPSGYAGYGTSKWARKERALTSAELEAIEKYGLPNLSNYLPKKPGDVELKVIKEMFEASVDGGEYDTAAWGQYFKPYGVSGKFGAPQGDADELENTVTSSVQVKLPEVEEKTVTRALEPVAAAPTTDAAQRAKDILAKISARRSE